MIRHSYLRVLPIALLAVLGACATTPKGPPPEVARLQDELDRLHADVRVTANAPEELHRADTAVAILATEGRRMDRPVFNHGIYLADRLVRVAEAEAMGRYAEQRARELGTERERLVAEARTRDLQVARATADNAIAAANDAQQRAALERAAADNARLDADAARLELDAMRTKLADLAAKQTERGLVVTLGDVLFEVDRAELKPGAARNLDQLVDALRSDVNTAVTIEGHTDATGSRDHNIDLSRRRAEAVQSYLLSHGIASNRIISRGLGPDYPVATNNSPDGRQQNRRVEVIVQTQIVSAR